MKIFLALQHRLIGWRTVAVLLVLCCSNAVEAGLLGVDVSHWQGLVNWNSIKQDGISYGFAKATEGVNYIDPRFATNMTNARLAGVPIGPYHFAKPSSSMGTLADPVKQDAINEANDFVDAIEPYYTNYPNAYLRPVLDVEELPDSAEVNTTSERREYLSDWINDFNSVVQDRLGTDVIIYTGGTYANNYLDSSIASYDLWFARWTYNINSPPSASNLGIWNDWEFWQWSNQGNYGGVSPIDTNYFEGDESDLAEYLVGPPELVGDYNGNGIVDAADYTVWRDSWLSLGENLPADGDNDGFVGNTDYGVWVTHYGETLESASNANTIPEPTSCVLVVMGLTAWCRKR